MSIEVEVMNRKKKVVVMATNNLTSRYQVFSEQYFLMFFMYETEEYCVLLIGQHVPVATSHVAVTTTLTV